MWSVGMGMVCSVRIDAAFELDYEMECIVLRYYVGIRKL